jgi:hypothetical protein
MDRTALAVSLGDRDKTAKAIDAHTGSLCPPQKQGVNEIFRSTVFRTGEIAVAQKILLKTLPERRGRHFIS